MNKIRNSPDESSGNRISETWELKFMELPLEKVSIDDWESLRMRSGQGPIKRKETSGEEAR